MEGRLCVCAYVCVCVCAYVKASCVCEHVYMHVCASGVRRCVCMRVLPVCVLVGTTVHRYNHDVALMKLKQWLDEKSRCEVDILFSGLTKIDETTL